MHKLVYLSVMRIVLFYFIFLLQFCVAAQNIGRLHFNNFEPAKKLGIPGVYSMFQDTTGIIWLGTNNGLFRYNGTEIFEFNAAEKKLLGKLNFVFLQDAAGNVIIGSNESICKYDIRTKKVRRLIYFKQAFNFYNRYVPIAFDKDSFLWCGIGGVGIGKYKTKFELIPENKKLELVKIEKFSATMDKTTGTIYFTNLHFKNLVSSTYNIYTGEFLNNPDKANGNFIKLKNKWLFVHNGYLTFYNLQHQALKTIDAYPYLNKNDMLYYKLMKLNDSVVWFSLKAGVLEINANSMSVQNYFGFEGDNKSNLLENISELFLDKQGTVFVCTENNGIFTYNTIKAQKFQQCSHPLKEINTIMQTLPLNDSLLIVSPLSDKLQLLNLKSNTYSSLACDRSARPKILSAINDSTYFANTNDYKSIELNKRTLTTRDVTTIITRIVDYKPIWSICTNKNNLYLLSEKLYKVNYNQGRYNSVANCEVNEVKQGTKPFYDVVNNQIVVNLNFKTLFFDENLQLIRQSPDLIGTYNACTYSNKTKLWYFATFDGLKIFDRNFKLLKKLTPQNSGINNDVVYSTVFNTDSSKLYLSTNKGISEFDITNQNFINYTLNDGVPVSEHNSGAGSTDGKGNYYFGNIDGVTIFNENNLRIPYKKPIVIVDSILVADSLYQKNTNPNFIKTIELYPNGNQLTINYSILQSDNQEAITYAYQLMDYDKSWTTSKNQIPVRYSNLPNGSYTLCIRGLSHNNVSELKYLVTVHPPFYLRWWFILLIILSVMLLVYSSVKVIINQRLKKKERQLETERRLFEQKTQISRDLHDNVGARLSMMLNTLNWMNKIESVNKTDLNDLHDNTKMVIQNLRETIWVMNAEEITVIGLYDQIKKFTSQFIKHSHIEAVFKEQINYNGSMPSQQVLNVYRIFQEALNNTIKYAEATKIEFNAICLEDKKLRITYWDNGKGFERETIKLGNGILNMKSRADEINATLSLVTGEGRGVKINIELYTK